MTKSTVAGAKSRKLVGPFFESNTITVAGTVIQPAEDCARLRAFCAARATSTRKGTLVESVPLGLPTWTLPVVAPDVAVMAVGETMVSLPSGTRGFYGMETKP
jgi:hypothetical protein